MEIPLPAYAIDTIDIIKSPSNEIKFDTQATIYFIKNNGDFIYRERVKKIAIANNNLVVTQISDGNQDIWEEYDANKIYQHGKLVGVIYSMTIGNYAHFKRIEIDIQPDIIPIRSAIFGQIFIPV
jgi:hypothetical protein